MSVRLCATDAEKVDFRTRDLSIRRRTLRLTTRPTVRSNKHVHEQYSLDSKLYLLNFIEDKIYDAIFTKYDYIYK